MTKLEFFNPRIQQISTSPILFLEKPSSKVEETVNAVKEKAQKETEGKEVVTVKPKKTIKQKVIDEVMHYYHGFKLLGLNTKISFKLALKKMKGQELSRREHNLFVETVADLFRLLPFSVFIIVPFLEFTLPLFIKIFPGMLPTTFQTKDDKEAKLKQSLKVKLEMAKFLQETLDNMSVSGKGHTCESAKEFADFFAKVRQEGVVIPADEILKFSKLFKDEITLDSLPQPQLVALCRVLELRPIGTSNFLRFQLALKLRSLAIDDKMIQKEGVDSLTLSELQQACKSRGMRAYGLTEKRLRQQLIEWLNLSLNEKVPPSLLLMSRAFSFTENIPTSDLLKKAISALPNSVGVSTEADLGEREGAIDNKAKLEAIKEEERKVKEEIEECKMENKKIEDAKKKSKEIPVIDPIELTDKAPILTDSTGIKEKEVTSTDLKTLENAIENLSSEQKKLSVEKEEIKELKDELKDYQEDINDLQEVMKTEKKEKVRESKAAKRLFKKVNNMIKNMDQVVNKLETKEKEIKKDIESKESADDKTNIECELIKIDELIGAVRKLQNIPDEYKLQQISEVLSKIDDDHDGSIRLDTVLKVLELIGTENIKLSNKEMDMITQLVIKEEEMETIEKMNKVQMSDKDNAAQATAPKVTTTTETVSKKTVTPIVDSKVTTDTKIPPIPPTNTTKSDEMKKL